MAINIIDGFYLGNSVPIDSRFVVDDSTERLAIAFKYDGLKVFQLDTRETWIWNDPLTTWDLENSATILGTGDTNYIPVWSNSSTLGTSSLYATSSKVGLNNTSPQSLFDIKDPNGSESLALNVRRVSGVQDLAVIGYNWYYTTGDNRQNASKLSTKIEMSSTNSLSVQTRTLSGLSHLPVFELNNSSGYNFLRALDKGNFISGSVSVSSGVVEFTSFQLMTVDGSFRTNSSFYSKITYLYWNGSTFQKQIGYTTTGNITQITTLPANPIYNIDSNDTNIIIRIKVSSPNPTLKLPNLASNNSIEIGREITIQYDLDGTTAVPPQVIVDCSLTNIINLDGITSTITMNWGDTVKFVSFIEGNNTPRWKLIQHVKANRVETWKSINNTFDFMSNGQPIPGFAIGTFNRVGLQPLRLRKVDDKYVHLQGSISINNYTNSSTLLTGPERSILTLPVGYRPLNFIEFPVLFYDISNITYTGWIKVSNSGGVSARVGNTQLSSSPITLFLAVDIMIALD
jgi:hypothetical protein